MLPQFTMHSATESSRAARSSEAELRLGLGLGGTGISTADGDGGRANGDAACEPAAVDLGVRAGEAIAQKLEGKAQKDEAGHKKGENNGPVHFGREAETCYGEKNNFGCHSKAAFRLRKGSGQANFKEEMRPSQHF